jgi:hypothetical protein
VTVYAIQPVFKNILPIISAKKSSDDPAKSKNPKSDFISTYERTKSLSL